MTGIRTSNQYQNVGKKYEYVHSTMLYLEYLQNYLSTDQKCRIVSQDLKLNILGYFQSTVMNSAWI
jgi:hypothetical protein